ncbi:MAG: hypothetical protein WCP21_12025, partial [Armatimonadota bacterium]
MSASLKRWALLPLLVSLPFLSLVAGKTWTWQNLLVVLLAALSLVLWGIGELLSSRSAPPPCHPERSEEPRRECPPWRPDAIDLSLVVFVLLQACSIIPSVYHFASELYVAKVLAYAITFWLLRYGLRPRRWWRAALWTLMSGGLVLA